MEDEIILNSVDVTSYRIIWTVDKAWQNAIDAAVIKFSPSVSDVVTITNGQTITIKRGRTTATDEFLFEGQITQIKPYANSIICICKGPLYEAIKAGKTKTWDKNIDTEGGVGSEIFKSLCDNSSLSYNSSSIVSTGTSDIRKINKFVQNDEDDFIKMNELADRYEYNITYDYTNGLVNFKPKGYTTYTHTLVVGTDIPGQIKWKDNMEQMINKVKIVGATVYDKLVKTEAGPTTTLTLDKVPEDMEVRHAHATTDTLLVRGVKDVGVFGTDSDYYVEEDLMKITFASNKSDIWVRYGVQLPMPVILKNQTSIDTYSPVKKTPHFKKFTFTDIKDIRDAEDRGLVILHKYSTPFVSAEDVPIYDSTLETYGTIEPGYLITINDQTFNSRTETIFVQSVKYAWPHITDKITVGDEIWRTENWQIDQMKKINILFSELNKNEDIVVNIFNLEKSLSITRNSFDRIRYKICDSFIVGHKINGLIGVGTALDSFEIGSAANWSGSNFTLSDSTDQKIVGTHSMKCIWAGGAAQGLISSSQSYGNISQYTGVNSGDPTKGMMGLWLYIADATQITDIVLRTGSSVAVYIHLNGVSYSSVRGYENWADLAFSLQNGWNYILFDLDDNSMAGTPDWTACDMTKFYITFTENTTIYLDYFTVSESNYIGLNGIGSRKMEMA